MKKPKVGIVTVNYKGVEDTIECVHSLQSIDYPNFEVIVVDNGSQDGSVRKLVKIKNLITLISLPENTGYTGGNNAGIQCALDKSCEYILLLNNDTTVNKNFLSILVDTLQKDKDIGLVGPKIYYSDKENILVSEGGEINLKKGPFLNINQNQTDKKLFTEPVDREYISGCCMLVKKEVFQKIGLLDQKYFCYVEDIDFCVRCRKSGFKTVYEPRSIIHHKTSRATGGEINPVKEFYKSRNAIYFGKKYYLTPFNVRYWACLLKNRFNDSKAAILNKNISIPIQIMKGLLLGVIHG